MSDRTLQPASPSAPGLPYKWKVLISVIFGIFMVILDTTVVNVAFQTLRTEFRAGINDSQWIISIYVLALGISTPLAGFLADRFGIKRIYLTGLTTFVTGSLLSGLAPGLWFLVGSRALQGLGGGIAIPLGSAMLFAAFPPTEQGLALGVFGIALLVAPALGPILGGLLVDSHLWRWIFFINIPIGILGVTLASRLLRERRPPSAPSINPVSIATSVVGFGSVLYAASFAAEGGWTSGRVLLWFGIGFASLAVFAAYELFRARWPLLNLRLYARRNFLRASLVGYVSVLALFGAEFLMPVYLQALRGRSALETGLILLPLAATAGITAPIAGRVYDKTGPRILLVAGFGVLMINTWQLSAITADTPIRWILFLLALRGLALGLTVQTTFVTALNDVPRDGVARGSSLINSTRFVVQSIGVAVLATVLAGSLSPQIKALQRTFLEAPEASVRRTGLCEARSAQPESSIVPASTTQPSPAMLSLIRQACDEYVKGFERAYRLTFYAALLAMLLGMTLPGWPAKWHGRGGLAGPPPPPAA
ncbi:MAG TPA: DHA2 family efflux MFS transporter permease subunit [bacterium]|jgi:DHA2 family multidrug resistance protein